MTLDAAYTQALAAAIGARHRRDGGSVMLLASRRTPPSLFRAVRDALEGMPGIRWGGTRDGPNPYPGVLGWADRLVATPDSVNMLSEACACGRPVHMLATATLPDKLARFHSTLRSRGLLHPMDAATAPHQQPLRETRAIACVVRQRLHLLPEST